MSRINKFADEIIPRLKQLLSDDSNESIIFDKHVAIALGIDPLNFALLKHRGKIPYDYLLDFCAKRRLSINWLLYGQSKNSLVDGRDIRSYEKLAS